jgi:predicted ribosome quality control (RQC) complex YloA/Tae2 family protein
MSKITVDDWENEGSPKTIALDPLLDPYLQAEAFFKRSRKLRLGIPHAERMLQQAKQESLHRQNQLSMLEKITSSADLQAFCDQHKLSTNTTTQPKTAQRKKPKPTKPYHIYALTNGLHAWVGKSAKDNDKLSFQHANGSDWWLHTRDYPGSHVVVRCTKNQTLEGENLKDAVELALRFSKAKSIKAGEVAITQAKYLKRVKGVSGKVQLSKHKVIHHTLDEKRWQRLKISRLLT